MAQTDMTDFSGLFKLDVLVHLEIKSYSFYELGSRKLLAVASDKELHFIYINLSSERVQTFYEWDFSLYPIRCMCFEPSGTWLLVVSNSKLLFVPYLPVFHPDIQFDHKWSLSEVSSINCSHSLSEAVSVIWWTTKESEDVIIIGHKTGCLSFFSVENKAVIGETKISGEIHNLQMCVDDSLDLITLLITGANNKQWKLILEHRSIGYNWLVESHAGTDGKERKDFMSYIRQFSKDKINLFTQGSSGDTSKGSIEYSSKPSTYMRAARKDTNNWSLTPQYVGGHHFITEFQLNDGQVVVRNTEYDMPLRTLRPSIRRTGSYCQALWTQRLVYLLKKNELEIHSSSFSVVQEESSMESTRHDSLLWSAELIGEWLRGWVLAAREPASSPAWGLPTFMRDLQLPRFSLESCLVATTQGVYLVSAMSDACEWVVGVVTRGGGGAEHAAAALAAPMPPLLRAAADLLLARGKLAPAHYLYNLSKSGAEGWLARLAACGRARELAAWWPGPQQQETPGRAAAARALAQLLHLCTDPGSSEQLDIGAWHTCDPELGLGGVAQHMAAAGMWRELRRHTVCRGQPQLLLAALKTRKELCRGALVLLLFEEVLTYVLEEENAFLLDFFRRHADEFDCILLKAMCCWLCPLQAELRPVLRDLRQGLVTPYTTRLRELISTFMRLACAIDKMEPSRQIKPNVTIKSDATADWFRAQRAVSCGLAHWAVADRGQARVVLADTPVRTELIGRVVSVACGRHHTLVLTENGVYSAGDNRFGQLGLGYAWGAQAGERGGAHGMLARLPFRWPAPPVALAAGHYHSAAIDAEGRLYTWGWGVHGQLGLGTINDEFSPKLVTSLKDHKLVQVCCGSSHSAALDSDGAVWAWGAAVFGQLGGGARDKRSRPARVPLPSPAASLACGYFHNLAWCGTEGGLWQWGASPQALRAAAPRARGGAPAPAAAPAAADPHLLPQPVDVAHLDGEIVQMSAGWHHSAVLTSAGSVYTWGLNFDGQLGTGNRKQVTTPTKVHISTRCLTESLQNILDHRSEAISTADERAGAESSGNRTVTKSMVACGGDFTLFIDDDGNVFLTGNTHTRQYKEDSPAEVIMMKTTKRVIRIPQSKSNKFVFQLSDRLSNIIPEPSVDKQSIRHIRNPLTCNNSFQREGWIDTIIIHLKDFITEEDVAGNPNVTAKLNFYQENFAECLTHQLENLKTVTESRKPLYLKHSDATRDEILKKNLKLYTDVFTSRIRDIGLAILNEETPPEVDVAVLGQLPCSCEERGFLAIVDTESEAVKDVSKEFLQEQAAIIIDNAVATFPASADNWEKYFAIARKFYVDNNLPLEDLEAVISKYVEVDASMVGAAILLSEDCTEYARLLSPKLHLNVVNKILDTWG